MKIKVSNMTHLHSSKLSYTHPKTKANNKIFVTIYTKYVILFSIEVSVLIFFSKKYIKEIIYKYLKSMFSLLCVIKSSRL